jgi:hypothetical protein
MAEIERYWNLCDAVRDPFHGYEQHFNIAPTVQIPVIFPLEGQLQLALARWDWCRIGMARYAAFSQRAVPISTCGVLRTLHKRVASKLVIVIHSSLSLHCLSHGRWRRS